MMRTSLFRRTPLLALALLLGALGLFTWLGMAAVAHGQAANENAFPPYDTRTPEKRVNITICR